jgi:chromosomal replication initiator protein
VPETAELTWDRMKSELRREVPDFKFHIWLEPLSLAAISGGTVYVKAPGHIRTWVGERYLPLLREAAGSVLGPGAVVVLVSEDWSEEEAPAALGKAEPEVSRLNPKYTFQQFVIGAGNRFAHAAALAVAELPGQAYNPLFIHGPPGLGKTHLLHAIGNYVEQYGSGLRVRYATIEDFTRGFIDAIRGKDTSTFKDGYRKADLVLIDDVQFLPPGAATREEFFHTFNALVQSGRQLVLTSDRDPAELPGLEARLAERFRSGLVVPMDPPGLDVRRAILEKRARLDGVGLPPDVLDEIALKVDSSVRALEGALIQVVAYASLHDAEVTPELARGVVERLHPRTAASRCDLTQILDATAKEFRLTQEELVARSRRPEVAFPRQVAMYLARELTDHSLPEIGRGIGSRNHATVLHAIKRVEIQLGRDPNTKRAVDNLRSILGRGG